MADRPDSVFKNVRVYRVPSLNSSELQRYFRDLVDPKIDLNESLPEYLGEGYSTFVDGRPYNLTIYNPASGVNLEELKGLTHLILEVTNVPRSKYLAFLKLVSDADEEKTPEVSIPSQKFNETMLGVPATQPSPKIEDNSELEDTLIGIPAMDVSKSAMQSPSRVEGASEIEDTLIGIPAMGVPKDDLSETLLGIPAMQPDEINSKTNIDDYDDQDTLIGIPSMGPNPNEMVKERSFKETLYGIPTMGGVPNQGVSKDSEIKVLNEDENGLDLDATPIWTFSEVIKPIESDGIVSDWKVNHYYGDHIEYYTEFQEVLPVSFEQPQVIASAYWINLYSGETKPFDLVFDNGAKHLEQFIGNLKDRGTTEFEVYKFSNSSEFGDGYILTIDVKSKGSNRDVLEEDVEINVGDEVSHNSVDNIVKGKDSMDIKSKVDSEGFNYGADSLFIVEKTLKQQLGWNDRELASAKKFTNGQMYRIDERGEYIPALDQYEYKSRYALVFSDYWKLARFLNSLESVEFQSKGILEIHPKEILFKGDLSRLLSIDNNLDVEVVLVDVSRLSKRNTNNYLLGFTFDFDLNRELKSLLGKYTALFHKHSVLIDDLYEGYQFNRKRLVGAMAELRNKLDKIFENF